MLTNTTHQSPVEAASHGNSIVARNSAHGQGHVQQRCRWGKYISQRHYHIANFFISSWNTIKLAQHVDS